MISKIIKIVVIAILPTFIACTKKDIDLETRKDCIEINNKQKKSIKFKVKKNDIRKIIQDFFYSNGLRSNENVPEITSISVIRDKLTKTQISSTLNEPKGEKDKEDLLYLVNLKDSSTMVIGADKRITPVYAYFENLKLEITPEGDLIANDTIPEIVGALMENYVADAKISITDTVLIDSDINNRIAHQFVQEAVYSKLSYRFPSIYNYTENSRESYNIFTGYDLRPWLIHALCIAVPDNVEIRKFNNYKLKSSWKEAKKLPVTQFSNDQFLDFEGMLNELTVIIPVPEAIITIALSSFSGKDGIPSLSYDKDWYNLINTMRMKTGISIIMGYRDRKHPTFFRHTSYHNFSFFLADGYIKKNDNYFIHVIGPFGNKGIVSGYVLDLNRTHASRFAHTHWTAWYGTPYLTEAINIHTTKYTSR